ncbi:MAG: hypothetical protein J6Q15_02145, partial [Clostridia bacterium]|nr:hypothetical protein [Clostridia bacterium]
MREFLVLFKHELKMLFPVFSCHKKKKFDFIGSLLSLVLTAFIRFVFIMLVAKIANGYVEVKFNKVLDPSKRATELLNILYLIVMGLMIVLCIKKMQGTLTAKRNKEIYLRLPVKEQTLFLSKLSALVIWNLVVSVLFILPINIIFYIALNPSFVFWLKTLFVLIVMPLIVFGTSTLLLVPVIKVGDYLKNKYWLIFVIISGVLIGAFVIYSNFLEVIQLWFETGSIKFLFNSHFIKSLQAWLKWAYPTNCFANIMTGNQLLISFAIVVLLVAMSVGVTMLVSNKLFHLTLYKTERELKVKTKNSKFIQFKPMVSLIKKEFICVYRNPRHLFSYFSIAVAMPAMSYCCYTLFESLILNAFGLKITFSLALLVLLVFSILTNTFCATNVSRDGLSFLKMKTFPIKSSSLLLAKVFFCGIVTSLSILVTVVMLVIATKLTMLEGMLSLIIAIIFSFAQILVATRLDLNNAKFLSTTAETENTNSKTITKIVGLGIILAF